MAFGITPILPSRGLDADSDLSRIAPVDYTDAKNISHYTDSGQTGIAIQNILGNELAFTIDATEAQNKTYRISGYDSDGTTIHRLNFLRSNGSSFKNSSSHDVQFTFTEGISLAATVTNAIAAITAAVATAQPSQTVLFGVTGGNEYFDMTITTVLGYNYFVNNFSNTPSTNTLTVQVTREAIPFSVAGEANVINSYDLLGDVYICSTSNTHLPTVLDVTIVGATNPGHPNPIMITTSGPNGLFNNQEIKISGVLGNIGANGTWIVQINGVSTTEFFLLNSLGGGAFISSPDAQITIYPSGIGEIGVAQYIPNSDTTTYTRLIRTREFNWTTKKQIDSQAERDNVKDSFYGTDDYNVPFVFYYYGPFVTDGALTFFNPQGIYTYGSIADETKLILSNTNVRLNFTSQDQIGGAVKSGNWRYAIRLLTESFVATDWSDLSNPINVFISATNGTVTALSGDEADVVTPKINNFEVTGIIPGLFKYIELAGVNYVGTAIIGYVIERDVLSGTTTQQINHSGTETGTTLLDVGTLNQNNIQYLTAKNIRSLDNRLILSNLTVSQKKDFTAWFGTFKYSILQKEIDNVGNANTSSYRLGEYADPLNVYNYVGYMQNETYRFGAKVRDKATGEISQTFHIADITIDCSPIGGQRVGTMASFNITSPGAVLVKYIEFSGIDLGFLIDGVAVRDLIDEIIFERVEMTDAQKTVLASGMITIGVLGKDLSSPADFGYLISSGEYPYVSGNGSGNYVTYPSLFTPKRNLMSFYSPDIMFGNTNIEFAGGDKLINLGQPDVSNTSNDNPHVTRFYTSSIFQYLGATGLTSNPVPINLIHVSIMSTGQEIDAFTGFSKRLQFINGASVESDWENFGSPVLLTSSNVNNFSAFADYGFYMAQYFRPKTDQYGDVSLSKYIPTGATYTITPSSPNIIGTGEVSVFGGDVFNQKTFLKYRFAHDSSTHGGVNGLGYGGAVGLYSQNRVNSQMNRRYDNTFINWNYPNASLNTWLQLIYTDISPVSYNSGYNIRNGVNIDSSFDSTAIQVTDLPTRIAYSNLKPQDSLVDDYRIFLPLNFRDLNLSFGEIMHHDIFNGELITWQPRNLERQFFNTTSELQTQLGSEVIIGDGAVLQRKGISLSVIGTFHKWSVVKGRSPQGKDTFYWINTELGKAMRLAADGTVSISDINRMFSFFANNLRWVIGKDTPADGTGICGNFSDRQIRWTVRGQKTDVPIYGSTDSYVPGDVVFFSPGPTYFTTFEETGEFYVANSIINQAVTPNQSPINSPDLWDVIAHTDTNYYNEYTVQYDEYSGTFSTFLTYKPKIYIGRADTFYTPRPISNTGQIYIDDKGAYTTWYDDGTTSQVEDGYITFVFNRDTNTVYRFLAFLFSTEIIPFRVDVETKNHKSFLLAADFDLEIDEFLGAIKNDILTSSDGLSNDQDTSTLWGGYIKIKFTYESAVFQKIVSSVLKFNTMARNYRK